MLITGEMEMKRAQMLLEGTSVVGMMDAQTMTINKERTRGGYAQHSEGCQSLPHGRRGRKLTVALPLRSDLETGDCLACEGRGAFQAEETDLSELQAGQAQATASASGCVSRTLRTVGRNRSSWLCVPGLLRLDRR